MNKSIIQVFTLALIVIMLVLTGCGRKGYLRDVESAPVVTTSGEYSLQDVRNAIIRAGSPLGWQMRPLGPGHIEGRVEVRVHSAVVDIHYDRNEYSITYVDSHNLKYKKGKIHNNYNGWIIRLERSINNELIQL